MRFQLIGISEFRLLFVELRFELDELDEPLLLLLLRLLTELAELVLSLLPLRELLAEELLELEADEYFDSSIFGRHLVTNGKFDYLLVKNFQINFW